MNNLFYNFIEDKGPSHIPVAAIDKAAQFNIYPASETGWSDWSVPVDDCGVRTFKTEKIAVRFVCPCLEGNTSLLDDTFHLKAVCILIFKNVTTKILKDIFSFRDFFLQIKGSKSRGMV